MDDNYSQYDHTLDDPHVIPGPSCLINRLDLTDTESLNAAEERFVNIRMAELQTSPIALTFDFNHLRRIHERLFGDVYSFAGQNRAVEFGKGGHLFLPFRLIDEEAARCFGWLHAHHLLAELDSAMRWGIF